MIRKVEIERFSLLEDITVEFSSGFNAISGETGAGKTLLLDAIDFVLGARASSQIFPATGGRCRVMIEFDLQSNKDTLFDFDPKLSLKSGVHSLERIARLGGTGRITLDGERITATDARDIAASLMDYSGQTENRALLAPRTHMRILDSFGDDTHRKLLSDYVAARQEHNMITRKLELINRGDASRLARTHLLEFEIGELTELNVATGERDELCEKRSRLANASRIVDEAKHIRDALAGDETLASGGARETIARADASSRLLAKYLGEESLEGEQWLALADDLSAMESVLGEVESAATAIIGNTESDPLELERIQARLAEIDRMALKYGCTTDELQLELKSREYELATLSSGDFDRNVVICELNESLKKCDGIARTLSEARASMAAILTSRVAAYLKKLDFAHSHFEIVGFMDNAEDLFSESIAPSSNVNLNAEESLLTNRGFRESGYDDIEFLVALNPNEPARPLVRVASGGEMSRLMLAITAALAGHAGTPVLMFDEIEAGVGGLTAQAVTDVMKEISKSHQIIAVTHLAQVAGRADRHFVVIKSASARTAHIQIKALNGKERRVELARMLGTDDPTKAELVIDEILDCSEGD